MPKLKKYQNKSGHYILTGLNGKIVTFQLTDEGVKALGSVGIKPDDVFGRRVLLDLYTRGLVFTHGTGPGEIGETQDPRQLMLDFDQANDPEPETTMPKCSECGAAEDLHIVTTTKADETSAFVLCPACRKGKDLGVSIPLQLVDRTFLKKLTRIVGITQTDEELDKYKDLLDRDFQAMWDEIRQRNMNHQANLGLNATNELGL